MEEDFDHIANKYDQDFTNSMIGKMQRALVYKYFQPFIQKEKLHILELNCGTGEDALWFAKKKHQVLATDISNEMIKVAKEKINWPNNLEFKQLDINKINTLFKGKGKEKFNLIFSNFGGLNCLNKQELQSFFHSSTKLVSSNGKLVLVIMPKNCFWESIYFLLKLDFKKAFRRNTSKALKVNVDDKKVATWYYNPKEIKHLANPYFKVIRSKPIGFFIPPSYMESYFIKYPKFLRILEKLEKTTRKWQFLARFSDHFLIELQLIKK